MPAATPVPPTVATRRLPAQRRSRERVGLVLDAAAELVVEHGVEALTTRAIAARAQVPVASIYQYFADRDDIVLALVQRDTAEMDERLAAALGALREPSLRAAVEATMAAFVESYHQRPAFVVVWWRGRSNAAVVDFCRAHNREIAQRLHDFGVATGLLRPDTPYEDVLVAVEVGDRVFELAFAERLEGDSRIVAKGIEIVSGYLERFSPAGAGGHASATTAGIAP